MMKGKLHAFNSSNFMSTVHEEKSILLEVSEPVKQELVADLCEWVGVF